MNHHVNPAKAALTFGAFLGGLHLVWSVLVLFGWAQPIVNFVLWMHMISLPYVVKAFDLIAATTLVVVTTIVGYILGFAFARIWNRMHHE